ncbi:MAG: Fic/DOC family N-terminal domain-containing protein [bacterium]
MNIADFGEGHPGRLVKIPDGGYAFVPDDLPPAVVLQPDISLMNLNGHAERAVGKLNGIGGKLRNPHLVIGPLRRREAIRSCKLEGTYTTATEIILHEAHSSDKVKSEDVQEVLNYIQALQYGLDRSNTLPVSNRLIRECHKFLLAGVRGQNEDPGHFRRTQNFIGPDRRIENARFVPPPVPDMIQSMDNLESFLHEPELLPPLIKLALIHYQFEAIHPFRDGNGRLGRLLIALLLCGWKLLDLPLLYLSGFLESHGAQYKDLLLAVSQSGLWLDWIKFFLRAVIAQANDGVTRSNMLLSLEEEYRSKLLAIRSSGTPLMLLERLFESPWISLETARAALQVTPRAAQTNINKLIDADILHEVTGRERNRVYVMHRIVEITEADFIDNVSADQ